MLATPSYTPQQLYYDPGTYGYLTQEPFLLDLQVLNSPLQSLALSRPDPEYTREIPVFVSSNSFDPQ